MARISQRRVQQFLQLGENGQTTTERGRALEDLICYIFEKIPGISVPIRNQRNIFNTEEIDVALWNEKHPRGFIFLPYIILIECKNWSAPVSSAEVSWFDRKLRDRGLPFGVLIAANGITGDAQHRTEAHSIVAGALPENRRIVVITRQEIELIANTDQIVRLIQTKLCELAVNGTVFP